ncbi:hypothetical protein V6N13_117326 [Hibiscus sabdariffa]
MIPKIKEITARLNDLDERRSILGLSNGLSQAASSEGKKPARLQPTSLMEEAMEYVGRDKEKQEMLDLLKSNNSDGVCVLSIVGMGGMGKTTLAQLVYNDASVESFDHRVWEWTILRTPFGAMSKIIVTTRLQNVSSMVHPIKTYHLDKLSHDDCLSIFTQHALRARNFDKHLQFKQVGESIMRKCDGLPLAAKAIGSLLCTKNLNEWKKVSESEGDGHRIGELKNLSNLRGDFCLSGLENVNGQDATEARLNEKPGIKMLFRQSSSFKDDKFMKEESDIQVDNFSPPKLSMTRSSSILGGRRESNTCSSTSLFLLFVATNLKSERICGCSNLVVCLEEIGLATTKLRDFNISGCENIGALPKCINNFTSLRALVVRRCSADISFPEEGFPTNLTQLQISNAPRISSSLFDWGFHRLTSLQRLDISGEGCSNVVSFPEERMTLPRSLTSICISKFDNLEFIRSEGFQHLTSLEELVFGYCPKLKSLPEKDKLLSLGHLEIYECPLLGEKRRGVRGRELSKISHIPGVRIDGRSFIPKEEY